MSDQDEWGPWIEHDGKGCPCVGQYVNALHDDSDFPLIIVKDFFGIAGGGGGRSWDWNNSDRFTRVIRYRIRKPKGLQLLTDILREVERDGDKVYGGREVEVTH